MKTRDDLQKDIVRIIKTEKDLIVNSSIRIGKTKIALDSLEEGEKVLWIYPRNTMLTDYKIDMEKFPPLTKDITFTNISSIHKYKNTSWDVIIVDEPQDCQSQKQLDTLKTIQFCHKRIGLSGSLSVSTLRKFSLTLQWYVKVKFSLDSAIKCKLVKDYRIKAVMIDLDDVDENVEYTSYGKDVRGTEMDAYESYCRTIDYFEEKSRSESGMLEFGKWQAGKTKYVSKRTNLIYNSVALQEKAQELLEELKDEKVLIYTYRIEKADELSEYAFHTRNHDENLLEEFKSSGKGHLAVVNSVSTGITIRNLYNILFHSYDSNTETFLQKLGRSLTFENDKEYSTVYTLVLKDTQNEEWFQAAIELLDPEKISVTYHDKEYTLKEWFMFLYPGKEMYRIKETGKMVIKSTDPERPGYYYPKSPEKVYGYSPNKVNPI